MCMSVMRIELTTTTIITTAKSSLYNYKHSIYGFHKCNNEIENMLSCVAYAHSIDFIRFGSTLPIYANTMHDHICMYVCLHVLLIRISSHIREGNSYCKTFGMCVCVCVCVPNCFHMFRLSTMSECWMCWTLLNQKNGILDIHRLPCHQQSSVQVNWFTTHNPSQ